MNTLHNKRVVILGATGLLGTALTETMLALGARVIAAARRRTRLDALRSELDDHERLEVAEVDITVAEGISAFARDVEQHGGADGLVNCTGFFQDGPTWGVQEQDVRSLFDTNTVGTVFGLRAFVPGMLQRNKGSIVLVAADTALRAEGALGVYGASKAAVAHLISASSRELLGSGVRINGLFPGMIASSEGAEGIAPVELCKAAAWLISDDSSFVSGSSLAFDGTRKDAC